MGFLDGIENMAAGEMTQSANPTAKVAGGLMQQLEQHPGGLGAVMENFRNNGMGQHVDAMQNGQTPQLTPDQTQAGLQGTGLIDQISQRVGVSPEMTKIALATVLPLVMSHFAQHGEAPNGGMLGGMLSHLL